MHTLDMHTHTHTHARMHTHMHTHCTHTHTHAHTHTCTHTHSTMYWADAGDGTSRHPAKIEKANMDGSHRLTIVPSKLGQPRCITIDNPVGLDGKIYWTDSYHQTIEFAELDGSGRTAIICECLCFDLALTSFLSSLSLHPLPSHLQSTDDHEFLVAWIVTHGEHSEGNRRGTQTLG